jgi:hypothetical protein
LNRGVGLYHAERHSFGNDRLCPDTCELLNIRSISNEHVMLLYVRDMRFCKIKCCLGLQIYHFYFVSEY